MLLTIRSFPANDSSDIMQDTTLRWVFAVVVILGYCCYVMQRKGRQLSMMEAPTAKQRGVLVVCRWCWSVIARMDLWARGQLRSALTDDWAVCLRLCSLCWWARLLRGVVCAGACGDLSGGAVEQSGPLGLWGGACLRVVLILLWLWGRC